MNNDHLLYKRVKSHRLLYKPFSEVERVEKTLHIKKCSGDYVWLGERDETSGWTKVDINQIIKPSCREPVYSRLGEFSYYTWIDNPEPADPVGVFAILAFFVVTGIVFALSSL